MNSQLNNSNDNQELEHPPHFKNVFGNGSVIVQQQQTPQQQVSEKDSDAMEVVENRRPSVVVPTNLTATSIGPPDSSSPSSSTGNLTLTSQPNHLSHMCPPQHTLSHRHHPLSQQHVSSPSEDSNLMSPSSSINTKLPSQTSSLLLTSPSSTPQSHSRSSSKTIKKSRKKKAHKLFKSTNPSVNSLPISKRFRSRSLPNIWLPSFKKTDLLLSDLNQKHQQKQHTQVGSASTGILDDQLLPPVNLQSLHEIDLHEILKNPQLRHDILFDPQLQFRPNLDGERGKRKTIQADKYWLAIKGSISLILEQNAKIDMNSSITIMFQTLKDILMSLLPSKDKITVEEIMDLNILIQQLNTSSFNFIKFSDWISAIFKMHCAPMRDLWVDEMNSIFKQACSGPRLNVDLLIEGLRVLFSVLEAMKLDVANHQIRIFRPLLCSTAVSFEKEYFQNAISKNKINLSSSLEWFKKNSDKHPLNTSSREILNSSIVNLLSCSNMCNEFPNTLTFDHSRLILLRADIRQLICIKICLILYQNLIRQYKLNANEFGSPEKLKELKREILNIIIDENGNSKWTRNLNNLSIHFCSKLFGKEHLDSAKIKFCFNWLLKQTQPNSTVYSIMERKMSENILRHLNGESAEDDMVVNEELLGVGERLKQLVEFHFNIFVDIYESYTKAN